MWVRGTICSLRIKNDFAKLMSLLSCVNEFPKTKRRKYPQYTSELGRVIMRNSKRPFIPANDYGSSRVYAQIVQSHKMRKNRKCEIE